MKNLFNLLEKCYREDKDKIAILEENGKMSYGDFYEKSMIIAKALDKLKLDLKKPILVLIKDEGLDLCVFMAILALGGFYVPISSKTPKERLKKILEDTDFAGIISADAKENSYINIEEEIRDLKYDKNFKPQNSAIGSDPALGLFTSGSTGRPKLVLKSHESILSMCRFFNEDFNFNDNNIFGNQVSFEFDSSLKSIYLCLYNRASLGLIPTKYFSFPKKIIDLINEFNVDTLIWSTFALRLMENFKVFSYKKIEKVKMVMFSGEVIPEKTIRYWMENVKADYYNVYAPTEYSFNCLYHKIKADENLNKIPAGKEITGSRVLILDEENRPCKLGEEGDLYLEGPGLAMGYYGDMEKTRISFIQNPLEKNFPQIIYKTGDRALMDENGDVYFKGRRDNQIKHQGYRIELGEIENSINSQKGVNICGVIFDKEKESLIAFYEGDIEAKELKKELKIKLPRHFFPKEIIRLEKLYLNANNKVDRNKLKEIYNEQLRKNNSNN